MALFPNVPFAPGVPSVLRDPNAAAAVAISLLTGDLVSGFGFNLTPTWGIYLNGRPVIIADTVVSLGFKREWAIADYQVEEGGFESYDKVDIPFDVRVQLASGGSEANRQALLDSVSAAGKSLVLYDVVTPEEVYTSVNVAHYDFRRAARNGLGLIIVDVWLLEIRVVGTSGQNVKSASAASPVQDGSVQTTDLTPSQVALIEATTPADL